MCYFGHGRNYQSQREIAIAKKIKQLMVRRIAIWFAYTEIARQVLLEQNVDDEKIVVVNNTLTVTAVLNEADVLREKNQFVYIGGLYKEKRIDLIFETVAKLRETHPELNLIIAGTGPEQPQVEEFAAHNPWCSYKGPVFGEDRDRLLLSSTAILMPGPVGLVAVDSFHYATPVITTNCHNHGPEVAYLEDRDNALILNTVGDKESYTELVRQFLEEPGLAEKIRSGCRESAGKYTLEDTASRFVHGVLALEDR